MKKYEAIVTFSGWYTVHVEAKSIEDAETLVEDLRRTRNLASSKTDYTQLGVFSVKEIKNEKV